MKAEPEQLAASRERFAVRHPAHAAPGKSEYEVQCWPSPTTEHIRVQCGCGYSWRYMASELFPPTKPPADDPVFRSFSAKAFVRTPKG